MGAFVNVGVVIVLFNWAPGAPDEEFVLYLLAAFWGVADAVWQTQINGNEMAAVHTNWSGWLRILQSGQIIGKRFFDLIFYFLLVKSWKVH